MTGVIEVQRWIDDLGPHLSVHAALLRGLLAAVESDSRWEWMELGCSVAAGRGDELSDLDLALAYGTGEPPPMDDVTRVLRDLGDVVDLAVQPWEDHHRWWVQYRDGGQIDLLVVPATIRSGRAPRSVVLLDRQSRLQETFVPSVWRALPGEPRQWLLDGWEALSNVVKYLHRGSLLECIEQLHRARTRVLQLWAVGEGVDYPRFGLASLLDDPQAALPEGIESTYPPAESAAVTAAADALARLLGEAGHHAETGLDSPLRSYVIGRIRAYVDDVEPSTWRG